MKIKVNLSKILGERRLKSADLAKKSGLSRYAIYELYHERTKGIQFETLAKLCKALGRPITATSANISGP